MLRNTHESLARALTRRAAQLTLVGALAATPLALAAGTASATDWDAIAQCESGGDWSTSTGNGFSGGLQFTPSTWRAFGGSGSPTSASREEQISVAERVKAEQGMNAWPTCSKKTGETSSKANGDSSSSKSSKKAETSSKPKKTKTETVSAAAPSAVAPAGAYTVASGDTLSSIAATHGVSWQQIAQRNAISNPDALSVGQQLVMS
jgi:resuscitation-promoting factor RpfA